MSQVSRIKNKSASDDVGSSFQPYLGSFLWNIEIESKNMIECADYNTAAHFTIRKLVTVGTYEAQISEELSCVFDPWLLQ